MQSLLGRKSLKIYSLQNLILLTCYKISVTILERCAHGKKKKRKIADLLELSSEVARNRNLLHVTFVILFYMALDTFNKTIDFLSMSDCIDLCKRIGSLCNSTFSVQPNS